MNKKKTIILILFLAVITVVSGCGRKQPKEPVVQNNDRQEIEAQKQEETATATEEIDTSDWLTYQNDFFDFNVMFPKNYKLCLNGFCKSYVDDQSDPEFDDVKSKEHQIGTILIAERYPIDIREKVEITQYVNKLNESATEFGKRMMEFNKKERNYYVPNSEKETIISGQKVYSFDVDGAYSFIWHSTEDIRYQNKKVYAIKHGNTDYQGVVVEGRHRIMFFDRGEIFYMIIYPLNSEIEQKIVDSIFDK